jgi:hypothetical protein
MCSLCRSRAPAAAAFALLLLAAAPAQTQSATLLEFRSGSRADEQFVVDSAGGFVARGTALQGTIPTTGEGTRLMWYHRGRE